MAADAVTVERLQMHRDVRGWVYEPLQPTELAAQRNAHVVLSQPGAVRGNHYHRTGTEVLALVGPALIRLRERGQVRELLAGEGEALRLTIPPGVSHAVRNTGELPSVIVSFNTAAHHPDAPDVVRDELI